MLIQANRVFLRQTGSKQVGLLLDGVEYAALAPDPALVLCAENAIKQPMRNLLRRQSAIRSRPAHVLLHSPAVGFLRHADLEGMEPLVRAHAARQDLVDRRTLRPSPRKGCTREQGACRRLVAVKCGV